MDPNRSWTALKTVYLVSKTIKKTHQYAHGGSILFYLHMEVTDPPFGASVTRTKAVNGALLARQSKKRHCHVAEIVSTLGIAALLFFPEIARALKPETQVHGSDVLNCSLDGPRFFVGFSCNLHFALDLDWKHVARWLLCWIPVWPADPLNV